MLDNLSWNDYAVDLDTHVRELEKKEKELLQELHKVRQYLRLTRQVCKHRDTREEWLRNGVPDPRRPEHSQDSTSTHRQEGQEEPGHRPARKQRILSLLAQDPERRWKTRDVADGLGDPQVKSVRVALDEMTRAGSITKYPDATYQHPTGAAENRQIF